MVFASTRKRTLPVRGYNGGYYEFVLNDTNPNYRVKEGETVTVN